MYYTVVYASVYLVGCSSAPIEPSNGSISRYSSREEGTTLTFHCNNGYIPEILMMSTCQNESWTPDPASLSCQGWK